VVHLPHRLQVLLFHPVTNSEHRITLLSAQNYVQDYCIGGRIGHIFHIVATSGCALQSPPPTTHTHTHFFCNTRLLHNSDLNELFSCSLFLISDAFHEHWNQYSHIKGRHTRCPGSPIDPRGPSSPFSPGLPLLPGVPGSPVAPFWPARPAKPFKPSLPAAPGEPEHLFMCVVCMHCEGRYRVWLNTEKCTCTTRYVING